MRIPWLSSLTLFAATNGVGGGVPDRPDYQEGWSYILSRTEAGSKVVSDMVDDGVLYVEPATSLCTQWLLTFDRVFEVKTIATVYDFRGNRTLLYLQTL